MTVQEQTSSLLSASEEKRLFDLRHEHIPKLLMRYAIPSVIGAVVNALYNIVDRIFIGQGVGSNALAGLAITFPILMCLIAFGMLVGSGASVRVSIYIGRNDLKSAERLLSNAVFLTLFFNIITCTLALIFMEPLLRMFGASDAIIPYAKEYLYIVIPGNIFCDLSLSYNAIMRASGYPRKAMYTMLIGALLNLILDPIFIFGFDWGIKGAAWATLLSEIIAALYVTGHFLNRKHLIHFSPQLAAYKPDFTMMKAILSIGIAPFTMMMVNSAINTIMNRSFVAYSTTSIEADLSMAALGIILGITQLFIQFMLGVSMGMQPIVGYNFGAGDIRRSIKTYRVALVVNISVATTGFAIAMLSPQFFINLFSKDPNLASLLNRTIRMTMMMFPFIGVQLTTVQFFQSLGISTKAMFLSLTRQIIYLMPCLLIIPHFIGTDGVWISMPIADALSGITALSMVLYQIPRLIKRHV
ncbi:MATE family efflux transporter [Porphyromonas circumdentaria]|uniref:Multidrug export protein MepA n=1 Tax=Porphyromonas circumdentaria TaxID=29524 RepID=A0A1T4PSK0_9PORP|nr:MATE family efflux transporter [Porphyromonas circumdentaria]MBB6276547.1 putative MATE family efflux protein [Porphyromonas circumdentaria]SJZ94523.1 putative efflux protein, MATE family [Porphyromonas circumdentaria]